LFEISGIDNIQEGFSCEVILPDLYVLAGTNYLKSSALATVGQDGLCYFAIEEGECTIGNQFISNIELAFNLELGQIGIATSSLFSYLQFNTFVNP
jgi:hypothetical protein